ncbi:ABC-type antimicrobial peptide transport system permease subunit [Microbacterium phyllosphaerae]|uniref:ABC-type antimicrobial peptide transport system permease subunit n=1 Tax=Microbacterium phyllosphaerae TaxID=124798 RepID=A0ABS4WT62_9MICO|nr:FtsX-like permease family protein [Microbacterium phyllosphaerae]MBP2379402.1 ABC-type antimicrobial peptide transport system permease subunit [Microbacterium phyllosphaerae]
MYGTYLRRELAGRKKQTWIVAIGLAIAIALVIIVNALTAGVRDAQAQALESVYGVGTDLTVTGAAAEPGEGGGQRFDFGSDDGATEGDTTTLSQSTLMTDFMRGTLESSVLDTVTSTDGVTAASAALSLTNSTFSGELPSGGFGAQDGTTEGTAPTEGQAPPQGGADGAGGGSFGVDSFTVLGIDPAVTSVGPLASVAVSDGRALDTDDSGALVALVDATYATTNEIAVGDTIDVAGSDVEVVGIVASTSDSADTAANVYLPLDTAQELSGAGDVISTVYVQAESAASIDAVQAALTDELPDATITSQSELASTVSGSLSSATSLITNLGTWLSIIVLAVAVLLSVLLTLSGVSRRTREFGTLKAIGWSNGRVVRQVAGESMVQGLIGGAVGLVLGIAGIVVINLVKPTVAAAAAGNAEGGPGGMGGGPTGGGGMFQTQQAADIVLQAPFTPWVLVAAVGLAVLGGLVAGAFGGWRAARLSPAEALRSVA